MSVQHHKFPFLKTAERFSHWRMLLLTFMLTFGLGLALRSFSGQQEASAHSAHGAAWHALKPERVVGPGKCGECHKAEFSAWEKSVHATSFDTMHRKEDARKMAEILGVRRLKTMGLCVECHYTPMQDGPRVRTQDGVSCESCHGAAKEWMPLHDDYGGKNVKRESETPQHRVERIHKSIDHGMHHPEQPYVLISQCYGCHVVDREDLITKTPHPMGEDFELVAWSQGEVRHNYLESDGKMNKEPPPERLRMFYVLGWSLDAEYSLLALARAQGPGKYADGLKARIERARGRLEEIAKTLEGPPEIKELVAVLAATNLAPGNAGSLTEASGKLSVLGRKIAENYDGKTWSALDPLLPARHQYKGQARE